MNLSGTFWLTTAISNKLKFLALYEHGPIAIDLVNPPDTVPPFLKMTAG